MIRMVSLKKNRPFLHIDLIRSVLHIDTFRDWIEENITPCCCIFTSEGLFVEESAVYVILRSKIDAVLLKKWDTFITNNHCKRKLTEAEKKAVAAEQRHRCAMCQQVVSDYEVDHIEQQAIRNNHHRLNLQMLCVQCHREKTRRDRQFGDPLFTAPVVTDRVRDEQGNVFSTYFRKQ